MINLLDDVESVVGHSCRRCGSEFTGRSNQVYCSDRCRNRLRYPATVKESCIDCGTTDGMDWWVSLGGSYQWRGKHCYRCELCHRTLDRDRSRVNNTKRFRSSRKRSQCDECAGDLPPTGNGHGPYKFCGSACADQQKRRRERERYAEGKRKQSMRRRRCECGMWFSGRTGNARQFCGKDCSAKVGYGPPSPGLLQIGRRRRCRTCSEMIPTGRRRVFCSARCCDVHNNRRVAERVMGLYRIAFTTGRVKEACRWRYVLVEYLRERDGDGCALCEAAMDFDAKTGPRGDDGGATVDHIVPWSITHDDRLSNLQLAHWGCNRAKGAGGGIEQLRLLG